MAIADLFDDQCDAVFRIGRHAVVLPAFARDRADSLFAAVVRVQRTSPFRHMTTPGGHSMSVATTNCGALGWTSDRRGYRYTSTDPEHGGPWPPMPPGFLQLASDAARAGGFGEFIPDACLINRYEPGTKLTLHQDKDEKNLAAPIVSVSLGMSAVFLFGGMKRGDKSIRVPLHHGDVVVWSGEDRLRFHGVSPIKDVPHEALGSQRINLTMRRAG